MIKRDSQLVFSQIKREFKVKTLRIIRLYHKVISLISKFTNIQFEWIPREQNKEADKLLYRTWKKVLEASDEDRNFNDVC
jgi:ribonuclease HI